MNDIYWDKFYETGKIADYLDYVNNKSTEVSNVKYTDADDKRSGNM